MCIEKVICEIWSLSLIAIMLSTMQEVSAKYWPNQGDVMEVDKYIIQNNNERTWGKYFVRRTLKVYNSKVVKVSLF